MRVGFFYIGTVPAGDNFGAGFDAALGYTAELPSQDQGGRTFRFREDTDAAANRLMDPENDTTGQLFSQANTPVYVPSVESSDLPFKVTFTHTRISTGGNPLMKLDVEAKRGQSNSGMIAADLATPYLHRIKSSTQSVSAK